MVTRAQTVVCTAVSPMSGSPTLNTEKKNRKTERGEFITPPRPTGRRSNNSPKKGNPQVIPTLSRGVDEGVEVYIARCIDCFTFKI